MSLHGCQINGCSNDGVYTAAALYGALTAPTVIAGCQITNNGLAGLAGAQSGVNVAGGAAVVTGNCIGQWNEAAGTGPQKYGVSTAVDAVTVVGNDLTGNAAAAVYVPGTLTLSSSVIDRNRGYTTGGGGTSGVSSFNARTGVVTLAATDVTAALGFTPIGSAPVSSVAGRTGAITLSHADISDWAAATSGFGGAAGVASFNSRTGAVTLGSSDVTGALGFTPLSAAPVASVAGYTGAVTTANLVSAGLVALASIGLSAGNIGHLDVPTAAGYTLRVQWGYGTTDGTSGSASVSFNAAFATACLACVVGLKATAPAAVSVGAGVVSTGGTTVYAANAAGAPVAAGFNYIAVGY